MLFLHKLLPIFVLPLGLVLVLLAIALFRKNRWPLIAGGLLLYLASLPIVGNGLMGALESSYTPVPVAEVAKADAIVPLGGIFGPPPRCQGCLPNLGEGNDRLEAGIELWQQKKAEFLVFTGGRIPWSKQTEVEGVASKRVAVARGVPADKILVTGEVGNTADEAHAIATMMHVRGWSKIILVTSAQHMPRAARTFRKAGVGFVPFPVDYRIDPHSALTLLDFLPSAGGLVDTETTLRELLGILFYSFRR